PAAVAAISTAKAAAAAETILNVIQSGDAQARYQIFASELKAATSPALVARAMARQPKVTSWRITSVDSGLEHATVDALLQTTKGPIHIVLVINQQGKLVAYQIDESAEASTAVANDFVASVIKGQFVQARSFLSLRLQQEISATNLQSKWLNLQREAGNFVRVRRVVEAERNLGTRVVLVTMEFTRFNDTLFVILDDRNQIVGLDFPEEPALILPAT
ncbi:MAG: DUF3887 domain-containing protein, partial [Cyanobacteriota bacterium]|nr:DUF3887 domain-containing protein [Cyanobacteriota bacterium]